MVKVSDNPDAIQAGARRHTRKAIDLMTAPPDAARLQALLDDVVRCLPGARVKAAVEKDSVLRAKREARIKKYEWQIANYRSMLAKIKM